MKFKCHRCQKETSFDLYDYVKGGKMSEPTMVLEMYTMKIPKKEDIVVICDNPDCKTRNKLTVTYEE